METHNSPAHEKRLKALSELRKKQEKIADAASNLWGYINEELGAKLLEQFRLENRIQSYVLACRGSCLDSSGVDALSHLWDESFMPLNFKSSQKGKEHHEEVYGMRIPSLVVNQSEDPELTRARYELSRLIDTWYDTFAFSNDQLVPCYRLRAKSAKLRQLQEEVAFYLDAVHAAEYTLDGNDEGAAIRISKISPILLQRRKYGYVSASISLDSGISVNFEFYRGAKLLGWAGKKNTALIVLPEATPTEDFWKALLTRIRKIKRTQKEHRPVR